MTLTRLLEIQHKWLRPGDQDSLFYAERVWRENGSPIQPHLLEELLERILTACKHKGIPYAPVLLKRKRQLGRGEWKPRSEVKTASADPTPVISEGDPKCSRCHGSGYIVNPQSFSASMCECNRWRREAQD